LERLLRANPVVVAHEPGNGKHAMRLAELRIDRQRTLRGLLAAAAPLLRRHDSRFRELAVRERETDVRHRVVRVCRDRALEVLDAFANAGRGESNVAVPALEVELIRLETRRRLLADTSFLIAGELRTQRGGDLHGHVRLDGEDVAQLAVVRLGPEVVVRPDV